MTVKRGITVVHFGRALKQSFYSHKTVFPMTVKLSNEQHFKQTWASIIKTFYGNNLRMFAIS
jgi:hypothetical protein